jgi:hypothetical protein
MWQIIDNYDRLPQDQWQRLGKQTLSDQTL